MMFLLLFLNFTVFTLLALLHFYWAVGGRWAYGKAVPTNHNGRQVFKTGAFGTVIVGAGLLLFAWVDLACMGWLELVTDAKYIRYGLWGLALIFLLRAIGDFRYVGIIRQRKHTAFARMDRMVYTPLCLFIALSHILIGLLYG